MNIKISLATFLLLLATNAVSAEDQNTSEVVRETDTDKALVIVDTTANDSIAVETSTQQNDVNLSLLTDPYPYIKPTAVEKAPPRVIVEVIPDRDSDADGVLDADDRCAQTPIGIKIDLLGCPLDEDADGIPDYQDKCKETPADVKVAKNGCPVDSDKDGIADYLDKCEDTDSLLRVDDKGCPLDDDGDGIPNHLDTCQVTPDGFNVDKNGCALTATLQIHFKRASGVIKKEDMKQVLEFSNFLKLNPKYKVSITGHTDNVGTVKANQKLSEIRALSLKNALIKDGIKSSRLTSFGKGESDPIATNLLASGREQNRRIEVKLIH